jgi:hypothetical protein
LLWNHYTQNPLPRLAGSINAAVTDVLSGRRETTVGNWSY